MAINPLSAGAGGALAQSMRLAQQATAGIDLKAAQQQQQQQLQAPVQAPVAITPGDIVKAAEPTGISALENMAAAGKQQVLAQNTPKAAAATPDAKDQKIALLEQRLAALEKDQTGNRVGEAAPKTEEVGKGKGKGKAKGKDKGLPPGIAKKSAADLPAGNPFKARLQEREDAEAAKAKEGETGAAKTNANALPTEVAKTDANKQTQQSQQKDDQKKDEKGVQSPAATMRKAAGEAPTTKPKQNQQQDLAQKLMAVLEQLLKQQQQPAA